MERIEPSNSVKMPAMNFGVCQITDPAECETAVLSDLKAGWRHHLDLGDRLARTQGGEPRRLKREAHARGHGENRDARHGHKPLLLSSRPEDRRVARHPKAAF